MKRLSIPPPRRTWRTTARVSELPEAARGWPILFEDEGQDDVGESEPHTLADQILYNGLKAYFADHARFAKYRVFSNLNLYYDVDEPQAFVSPDTMVAVPLRRTAHNLRSYRIGKTGPAPLLTVEVLSDRSWQQQDMQDKPELYAHIGIPEYILVDPEGKFLTHNLLLMRLQPDRTWKSHRDTDEGITSVLGFRLIMDHDGQLRVLDDANGKRYVRPDEAQAEAEARRAEAEARRAEAAARLKAEQRVRELEAELERLRSGLRERKKNDR